MAHSLDAHPHLMHEDLVELLADGHRLLPGDARLAHLSQCDRCQRELEQAAADATFWLDATRELRRDATKVSQGGDEATLSRVVFVSGPSPRTPATDVRREASLTGLNLQVGHPELLGRIDHFDIEEVLGRGGMGIVFRGFDRELNRPVAVKFLAPHLAAHATARQRFIREARAAAGVVHPNVVPIHAIHTGPQPYLVMSLVAGKSIQQQVESDGPLPAVDVVRAAMQVAAGLAAAHRQGLIHRDIKPANILSDGDAGRVLLTDFGLARAADDASITQTGWLAGTPHYMSPEQARGEMLDQRSDLFSLGSTMYFMATGREPFRHEHSLGILNQIAEKQPLRACDVQPEVPLPLARLIEKLMQKRPDDRVESAEQLGRILESYLAHLQQPSHAPLPRELTRSPVRRTTALHWIVTMATLAAVTWAGWSLWLASSRVREPRVSGPPAATRPEAASSPNTSRNRPLAPGSATAANDDLLSDADYARLWTETEVLLEQLERLANRPAQLSEMGRAESASDTRDDLRSELTAIARELEQWESQLREESRPGP